jgi:pimeloyl-ACP methyl ester carboxylesterase
MNKLILLAVLCLPTLSWGQAPVFTGNHGSWHEGFDRYDYIMDEQTLAITPYERTDEEKVSEGFGVKDPPPGKRRCIVVVPLKPAPGNPWSWQACYWDHQPQAEVELLKRGFFVCYISANATLQPGKEWDAWYAWLTREKGLSLKPAFVGMSRGGQYEYRWATTHPDAVSCIYADNPAVDRASLTLLGGLAADDVPLLHVCGSIDPLYTASTAAVENIYHAFGGRISVMIKEGFGHHPHSLHDATPIADFIEKSFREKAVLLPGYVKATYGGPGAATKTWYCPVLDSYRWVPAEKAYISSRGPFFSAAYARYQLLIPGVDAFTTVIAPDRAAPGTPWVFRADYVGADDRVAQALLAKGWTIVTGAVPYNYDGPVPSQWNAIYAYFVSYGFALRPVMMGRGGAAGEAVGWAIANPEKVACVYAENPILTSKLMLGGKAPLDSLAPLAKAGVPMLFVCGNEDPSEQTLVAAQRYRQAGGKVTVNVRKGEGHFLAVRDTDAVLAFMRTAGVP